MKRPRKYGRRYPWSAWFDRARVGVVRLWRGRDYDCAPYVFAAMLRNAAGRDRFRLRVETKVCTGHVELRVTGRMEPCPA